MFTRTVDQMRDGYARIAKLNEALRADLGRAVLYWSPEFWNVDDIKTDLERFNARISPAATEMFNELFNIDNKAYRNAMGIVTSEVSYEEVVADTQVNTVPFSIDLRYVMSGLNENI